MCFHKKCESKKCSYAAKNSAELRDHVNTVHGRLTCMLCREECMDESSFKKHQESHEIKRQAKTDSAIPEELNVQCKKCKYKG